MITKQDLAAAEAAIDELEQQSTLVPPVPSARLPLDADPSEERAPDSTPITYEPRPADSPAVTASPAVPFLDELRALRERIEQQLPTLIAGSAGDSYDLLLALKQESGKLNDTLYGLWIRQACTSLKQ